MITIKSNLHNFLKICDFDSLEKSFQDFYDSLVSNLLDEHPNYSIHAYYTRTVFINDCKLSLLVTRVADDSSSTHAILPSFLIPYKPHPVDDYLDAMNHISNSNMKYVLRWLVRKWLKLFDISFDTFDISIVAHSFHLIGRQFLQIRNISNTLISTQA